MTPQSPRTGNRERRLTRDLTWAAVAMAILRSHRFQDQVIVGAIALAALAGLSREMRTHTFARARAWARRLDQRAEHAIKPAKR